MQPGATNKLLIGALVLAAVGLETGYGWGGNRMYRRIISLSPATTAANFQVAVVLGATNFNYAHATPNGGDLLFTDISDGALEHWVENWNATGESKLWVKVAATNTSTIRLYYGDPSTNLVTAASNVFLRIIGQDSQSLKGSWNFDETSGTTVYDSSGDTNHGTASGTTITNGKFGYARYYSATNSRVLIGSAPSCNFTTNDFSIEAWIRMNKSFTNTSCVIARYSGWPMWYFRVNNGNTLEARVRETQTGPNFAASDGGAMTTGVWSHVVVTYNRDGNMTRYVNGAVWGTPMDISVLNGSNLFTVYNLTIGNDHAYDQGFKDGEIDDARVYGDLLSPSEVADLYNNQGYTTTNYPGRVLVRKCATPEPSLSLGAEIRFDRGTVFSTK